jgi:hypothetical protein
MEAEEKPPKSALSEEGDRHPRNSKGSLQKNIQHYLQNTSLSFFEKN